VGDDRRRFEMMAERDRVRYENDMRLYMSTPAQPSASTAATATGGRRRRKRNAKDPDAPKRATYVRQLSIFFDIYLY